MEESLPAKSRVSVACRRSLRSAGSATPLTASCTCESELPGRLLIPPFPAISHYFHELNPPPIYSSSVLIIRSARLRSVIPDIANPTVDTLNESPPRRTAEFSIPRQTSGAQDRSPHVRLQSSYAHNPLNPAELVAWESCKTKAPRSDHGIAPRNEWEKSNVSPQ